MLNSINIHVVIKLSPRSYITGCILTFGRKAKNVCVCDFGSPAIYTVYIYIFHFGCLDDFGKKNIKKRKKEKREKKKKRQCSCWWTIWNYWLSNGGSDYTHPFFSCVCVCVCTKGSSCLLPVFSRLLIKNPWAAFSYKRSKKTPSGRSNPLPNSRAVFLFCFFFIPGREREKKKAKVSRHGPIWW